MRPEIVAHVESRDAFVIGETDTRWVGTMPPRDVVTSSVDPRPAWSSCGMTNTSEKPREVVGVECGIPSLSAARVRCSRYVDARQSVGVLLTLDNGNCATCTPGLLQLGPVIRDLPDAIKAVDPSTLTIRPGLSERLWVVPRSPVDDLAVEIEVVVGRDPRGQASAPAHPCRIGACGRLGPW